jgi:hypothetical protein
MNKLIELLIIENDMTISGLKKLYRNLSKRAHADLTKGSEEIFIKLKKEYDDAVNLLLNNESINIPKKYC